MIPNLLQVSTLAAKESKRRFVDCAALKGDKKQVPFGPAQDDSEGGVPVSLSFPGPKIGTWGTPTSAAPQLL
jgi:hypothetical protein